MSPINISCKRATELIEKKGLGPLTFTERLKLYIHQRSCNSCKIYEQQSTLLDNLLRHHLNDEKHIPIIENPSLKANLITKLKAVQSSVTQAPLLTVIKQDGKKNVAAPSRIRYWQRLAAAVLLLVVAGYGIYLLVNGSRPASLPGNEIALGEKKAPDRTKAVITLVNGQTVYFDSIGTGQVALQGNVKLIKPDDQSIIYEWNGAADKETLRYNTLSNPRGSKIIEIKLSDGTHVWLNAGSSITYPVAFDGSERHVELKGEGYFEVAADINKRFTVSARGCNIQVLGTHFNVNTYSDDAKITLLEGSVKINSSANDAAGTGRILKPGQQGISHLDPSKSIEVIDTDPEQAIAWRKGLFQFNAEDVNTIAQQLGIWYDADIIYQGTNGKKVTGYIDRSVPLHDVLQMLEYTSGIHFKITKEKIILQ